MKITNYDPEGFPLVLGGWSSGVVSLNSNAHMADGGFSALNFVQGITAEGSNMLARPIANFAAGSNIWLTLDAGPGGSIPSNTIRIHGLAGGGAAVSAGSNSTRVREVSTAGASTTLWSPFDHAHDGIGTITSSSSNTMQRGTWNIRSGAGIALSLTDTDGDGEFDTTTIINAGSGAGGGLTVQAFTDANVGSPGTITSTSYVDIDATNLKKTVSGVGPFYVFAQLLLASISVSQRFRVNIAVDGTEIYAAGGLWISPVTGAYWPIVISGAKTATLSAGSHTIALRGKVDAGTASFDGQIAFVILG
jgi:hypothetical protein